MLFKQEALSLQQTEEKVSQEQTSINLNKYLSSTGICSRREADRMIESGRVKLNGQVAFLGNRVYPGDKVLLDNRPVGEKKEAIYIALNKPKGIVSTTDSKEPKNIISFLNYPERLFPIGRLDKPSQGLIFLTNDGDIVNKILRAGNAHEKEYKVVVDKPIDDSFVERMSSGIPILGRMTKKCKVEQIGNQEFKIILIEGLNRQIRRMCEYLGYEVKRLERTRIMNIDSKGLKAGDWRYLTEDEIAEMNRMVEGSSKTEEASVGPKPKKKSKQNKAKKKTETSEDLDFGQKSNRPKKSKSSKSSRSSKSSQSHGARIGKSKSPSAKSSRSNKGGFKSKSQVKNRKKR